MLVVIEGVDCSGKETQSKMLVEKLKSQGKSAIRFQLPFYDSPTGKIIANPYLGKDGKSWFDEGATHVDPYVASLFYVADRVYNLNKITQAMKEYDVVVLDRYLYSNMAHHGCKLKPKQRTQFFEFIEKLEIEMLKMPVPDVRLFLFVPSKVVSELKRKRNEKPDEHEKDVKYLQEAEKTYIEIAKRYDFKQINCAPKGKMRSPEDISNEIYKKLYE